MPNPIFDLFVKFSILEAALKQSNYCKSSYDHAAPDWTKFIKENHKGYKINPKEYIFTNPPNTQNCVDGKIIWEETLRGNKSNLDWTVKLIKTVRNNLFHGGKYPIDPERDIPLIMSALNILQFIVSLDERVEEKFHEICEASRDVLDM